MTPSYSGHPAGAAGGSGVDFQRPLHCRVSGFVQSCAAQNCQSSARQRWSLAPDVPTADEAGYPGIYIAYWHGLWAPKGTPKDVISKLTSAVQAALDDATVQQRFAVIGQEVWPREQRTPEALAIQQKAEIEKWWPVIKTAGIKAE